MRLVTERAFLSLGSNIDPERNLPRAARRLTSLGRVLAISAVYQNPAMGPTPQADFLNAAVLLETPRTAGDLHSQLRKLEEGLGRRRVADKSAPRTIDIDIVLYGSHRLHDSGFVVPDPDLLVRPHLAIPLAELDPQYRHPVTGESLAALADRLRPKAVLTPRPEVRREMRLAIGLDPDSETAQ